MSVSIVLQKVAKKYGSQTIFSQLDLNLGTGSFSLEGANGVGKSSLIKLITGIEPVDEGKIFINGLSIKGNRYQINQIRTYLPDCPAFYNNATVEELISILLTMREVTQSQAEALVKYWRLDSLFYLRWKELSLGQQKRVFCGVSLLETVPIWILDEPSNSLDKEWIPKLAAAIEKHSTEGLILFSNHDEVLMNLVRHNRLIMTRSNDRTEVYNKADT